MQAQNIVENAIKYAPEDSAIRVTVAPRENAAEVSVEDEGPGIAPEDRCRLSERFYRPDRSRGRDSGGFGLGLSITKAYLLVLGYAVKYYLNEQIVIKPYD